MPTSGKEMYVPNTGSGASAKTVAAPAMLFHELNLGRIDRDFDQSPNLPGYDFMSDADRSIGSGILRQDDHRVRTDPDVCVIAHAVLCPGNRGCVVAR